MSSFNTPITKVENLIFGGGVCYFAPLDAAGIPRGERDLGECPSFSLNITSETVEFFSSRSGTKRKIRSVTTTVDFNAKLEFADFSIDNLGLFIAGGSEIVVQAATPVTNERIFNLESGREYQFGATVSNPSGIRGMTSVTVFVHELKNAVARVNSTPYVVGDIYKVTTNVFIVTANGTSAGSAPTYDTAAVGNSTTDGGATVKFIGTTAAYTVVTDYILNANSGRIAVLPDANLGLAADLYTEVTGGPIDGDRLSLSVNYTPEANERIQVNSAATGKVIGQFRYISENAEGDDADVFIASCSLRPSGDLAFITGQEFAKATFDLGINERDTSTPQIIIDKRPYVPA